MPEFWKPITRESADHSLPFCLAAALIDGDITTETFDQKRFLDTEIISVMDKITIELNEKFNAVAPEDRNCRITAALSSGREVKAEKCHTRQYSERPIPKHLVEEKFRKITANTLSTKARMN